MFANIKVAYQQPLKSEIDQMNQNLIARPTKNSSWSTVFPFLIFISVKFAKRIGLISISISREKLLLHLNNGMNSTFF